MPILTVTAAISILRDANERSYNRDIFAEGEAGVVLQHLKGFSVDDTKAIAEACGFAWQGSRPKTLTYIHDRLDAGWRAWRRIQA